MKLYTTDDGTAVDLEHVLAVSPVFENYGYVEPYMYVLTLAFNSTKIIGYENREQADQCRQSLINAWNSK